MKKLTRFAFLSWICAVRTMYAQDDCRGIGTEAADGKVVPNRVIVAPADHAAGDDKWKSSLHDLLGDKVVVQQIDRTGAFTVDSVDRTTSELLTTLKPRRDLFDIVQEDRVYRGHQSSTVMPNDDEFVFSKGQLWGLRAIHAPEAWFHGTGSSEVIAAIVDSGIFREHEDLMDNVIRFTTPIEAIDDDISVHCVEGDFGYDAIAGDCQPEERNQHGTHVAGIMGARGNNDQFVVGVNWQVTLLPVAFLDAGNGGCESRAVKALQFVHRMKEQGFNVRVVNLSWGAHVPSPFIETQLKRLSDDGIVIVASAGNDGTDNGIDAVFPASHTTIPTLIAVAATMRQGGKWGLSNFSPTLVHIAAPGADIRTTSPGVRVVPDTGTSMAAAFVTGAVALIASQCPSLTAIELRNLILKTADHKRGLKKFVIGGRFLDVGAAAKACAKLRGVTAHSPASR